ncbi:MAG: type III ribulose-bisphosphate carboxylase [Candidatus Diapherotrites archaeon]
MTMDSFIRKNYRPAKNEIVAHFRLKKAEKLSFEECLDSVARESSIGTWTELVTLEKNIAEKLGPKIFDLNESAGSAKIAYPLDLFEKGNLPQFWSGICGNIYGMSDVQAIRLDDVDFPAEYQKSFKGPKYGIGGVRKTLKVKERPLVGTIVKPKVGLDEKGHAKCAYEAWLGGCDIVKDDENLTSMKFNNFKKRISLTLKMLEKAEKETGEKKAYMPNVTSETFEMLKRAKYVEDCGGTYAMIDIIAAGLSSLQTLRNQDFDLIIHAHRAGHAAFTRNKEHGISMLVLAKLARLAGVDQLHVGAVFGKMEGGESEVREIVSAITEKGPLKNVFPVCSGGLYPSKVPPLMKALGNDIIIQAGGGISGHPQGTIKGSIAMRQAVDATLKEISLQEYGLKHKELGIAMQKWGT